MKKAQFRFSSLITKYAGPGGWYFAELPADLSEQLRTVWSYQVNKVAWGYIKVKATVGKTNWETTLFPQKNGPYLLAIKEDIRRKQTIQEGDTITITCELL